MTLWPKEGVNNDEGDQKQTLLFPKIPHDRLIVLAAVRLEEQHLLQKAGMRSK